MRLGHWSRKTETVMLLIREVERDRVKGKNDARLRGGSLNCDTRSFGRRDRSNCCGCGSSGRRRRSGGCGGTARRKVNMRKV
jgi:hypothetical protein